MKVTYIGNARWNVYEITGEDRKMIGYILGKFNLDGSPWFLPMVTRATGTIECKPESSLRDAVTSVIDTYREAK